MYLVRTKMNFKPLFWSVSSWEYPDILSKSASAHFNRRHISNRHHALLTKFLYWLYETCFLTFATMSVLHKIFDLNSASRGHKNPYHRHASLVIIYYLNCKTTRFKVLISVLYNPNSLHLDTHFNLFVEAPNTFKMITSCIYCRVNKKKQVKPFFFIKFTFLLPITSFQFKKKGNGFSL